MSSIMFNERNIALMMRDMFLEHRGLTPQGHVRNPCCKHLDCFNRGQWHSCKDRSVYPL